MQQISILLGCAVLPHLKALVDIVKHGLTDENQKVLAERALPPPPDACFSNSQMAICRCTDTCSFAMIESAFEATWAAREDFCLYAMSLEVVAAADPLAARGGPGENHHGADGGGSGGGGRALRHRVL